MIAQPLLSRFSSWLSHIGAPEEASAVDWQAMSSERTAWNFANSPYFRLPSEIHALVVQSLPAEDILASALVCRAWHAAAKQEHLWRTLFQRDAPSWQMLGNASAPRRWPGVRALLDTVGGAPEAAEAAEGKWREAYLRQYRLNRSRFAPAQVAAKLSLSLESALGQWELRLPFARKVHRILMFGEGLETSARKLLYTLLWSKNSPFQMTRAYPGVEGVGSGFGFRVGTKELALAALYKYDTPGIFDRVRPQWRELFLSTAGFVFVVDPSQDLGRARADLASFIDAEWIPPAAPLLVLVVHRAARDHAPPPSVVAVADALQLSARRSKQFLVRHCAWPDGIHAAVDGISWLSENV